MESESKGKRKLGEDEDDEDEPKGRMRKGDEEVACHHNWDWGLNRSYYISFYHLYQWVL